ncbi:MAG: hypothetical protein QM499_05465 [Flavobacteriaceae bacterium]
MNLKQQIKIAFGYFFIVALLGVFMRMFHVADITFNYKNILHTHSHIALLGWVYTALTTLIYKLFLSEKGKDKTFNKLFWSTQISIIGMMFSFPFTGYAFFSIVFSTLFLLNSYVFIWLFLKHTSSEQKQLKSYKLIRASLWLMVFSSLGPWALGIIMNTLGSTSPWYRNAIYFFLHFQYNGWFLVALLGLFFAYLEKNKNSLVLLEIGLFKNEGVFILEKKFKLFYNLFLVGVFLTFFHSVLWMKPSILFNALALIGSIFQFAVFIVLLESIQHFSNRLKGMLTKIENQLLKTVKLLFILKLTFQIVGSFPVIANLVSMHKDLIIAYLHWVFLGIVSISIFLFLSIFKFFSISKTNYKLYFLAFLLTEALLFGNGIFSWFGGFYYLALFLASAVFVVAIFRMIRAQFKNN